MATNNFDPTKYGATKFDPLKYGASPIQQTQKKSTSLLEKAGNLAKGITTTFLPSVKTTGEALGAVAFRYLTPEGRELYNKVNSGTASTEENIVFEEIFSKAPTVGQQIGANIQTATTVLAPQAKGIKGVATLGAVAGFGKGIEEKKPIPETLKQSFVSGIMSGFTYGVITGAGKLAKSALDKLPTKLYNSTIKIDKESADILLNDKQWGDLGKIKGVADKQVEILNESIASKITPTSGTINSNEFMEKIIKKVRADYPGVSAEKLNLALKNSNIDPFINEQNVNFSIADKIRKEIGNNLHSVWNTDNPKFNQEVRMSIWEEIVNKIRPTTNTVEDFKRLTAYTRTSIKLNSILEKQSQKFGIGLTDLITGLGIGLGKGGTAGATAVVAKKAIESPVVKTATAVGLNELNKIIPRLPWDATDKISKTVLINAMKEFNK